MNIKAVIFNMDGVLLDTARYHYLSWKKVADRIGIPFTRGDNDKLRGLSHRKSLEDLLAGMEISEEEVIELLNYKNSCFMEYVETIGAQELLPGVISLFQELRAADISMAVASLSQNAHSIIGKLEISKYIEVICDGNSQNTLKPYQDIYLQTALALQVLPQKCIVIEDGEAGIKAASAAGVCVVGVGKSASLDGAQAVFTSLANVKLHDLERVYSAWYADHRIPASVQSKTEEVLI